MSDPVTIAIIGGFQAIVIAFLSFLTVRLRRVDKSTKATRAQVENSHTENFRDDTDNKHVAVMTALTELKTGHQNLTNDIGGLRADIRQANGRIHTLEELELTQPRKREHG